MRRAWAWAGGRGRAQVALGALLTLLVALAVGIPNARDASHEWSPDSVIYLRMMLQDTGRTRDEARREADRYVLASGSANVAKVPSYYSDHPPAFYATQFDLFKTRPLFPFVSSLLYGAEGPHALDDVSAAAAILAAVAMFGVLLLVAAPWLAFLGAGVFAGSSPLLAVAGFGTTDALALLWWVVALGFALLYLRRADPRVLGGFAVAALGLAFTRPIVYLPLGAALGALALTRRRGPELRLVAVAAVVAAVFLVFSALDGGAGLRGQLHWVYAWQKAVGDTTSSFGGWYVHAVPHAASGGLSEDIHFHRKLILLALVALAGLWIARRRVEAFVAIGAGLASLVSLLVNPYDFVRTVELPLIPVVVLLAVIAAAALARRLTGLRPRIEARPA